MIATPGSTRKNRMLNRWIMSVTNADCRARSVLEIDCTVSEFADESAGKPALYRLHMLLSRRAAEAGRVVVLIKQTGSARHESNRARNCRDVSFSIPHVPMGRSYGRIVFLRCRAP